MLLRTWIGIIAHQPPFARALLLVLVLATLAMYVLGLASVVIRARLPSSAPVDEEVRRIVWPTSLAAPAAEVPDPTEAPVASTPTARVSPVPARTPLLRSAPSAGMPTPTLEPTPSQDTAAVATRPLPSPTGSPAVTPRPSVTAARVPPSTVGEPPPRAPAPSSGTLGPGGTFAKSEFIYPGDGSVYTVNLHVEPDDAGLLQRAGFIVYGPNGEEVVRGGAQPGRRPNVSANVINTRPGGYVVQVQNYDPSRSIAYRLEIIAGPRG
jgi:hypothetical protein